MSARSTRSSILEETLLTFWPPGPPERTAFICRAAAGTRTAALISMGSSIRP